MVREKGDSFSKNNVKIWAMAIKNTTERGANMSEIKKKKILAAMLCATSMASFYAAPHVEAAEYDVTYSGSKLQVEGSDAGKTDITAIDLGTGTLSAGTVTLGLSSLTATQLANINATVTGEKTVDASSGLTLGSTNVTTTGTVQGTIVTDGTASLTAGTLTGVTTIDGAAVAAQGTGGLTVAGVEIGGGTNALSSTGFTVEADGDTTVRSLAVGTTGSGFDSTGNLAVANDKFTVDAATGNTSVAGTLAVSGNTDLAGSLMVGTNNAFQVAVDGTTTTVGTITADSDGNKVTLGGTNAIASSNFTVTGDGTLQAVNLNTDHQIGSVAVNGNTINYTGTSGTDGSLVVEGVTLQNGTITAGNGNFKVNNQGGVTAGESIIGGVMLGNGAITANSTSTSTINGTALAPNGEVTANKLTVDGVVIDAGTISGLTGLSAGSLTGTDSVIVGNVANATTFTSTDGSLNIENTQKKVVLGNTTLNDGGAVFGAAGNQTVISGNTLTTGTATAGTANLGDVVITNNTINNRSDNTALVVEGVTVQDGGLKADTAALGKMNVTGNVVEGDTNGLVIEGVTMNNGTLTGVTAIDGAAVAAQGTGGLTVAGVEIGGGTNALSSTGFTVEADGDTTVRSLAVGNTGSGFNETGVLTAANGSTIGGIMLNAGALTGVTAIDGANVQAGLILDRCKSAA